MVCTCSFSTLFLQLASLLGQFQQLHRWGVGAGEGGCTSEAVESGQEGKWTELGHHNNVLKLIWSNVDSSRVVMPQVLTIFFPFFWQLVGRNDSRGVTWQTKKSVRKIFLDTIFWEETFCIIFSLVWTWTLAAHIGQTNIWPHCLCHWIWIQYFTLRSPKVVWSRAFPAPVYFSHHRIH